MYGPFKKVNSKIIFSSKPVLIKCLANNKFMTRNLTTNEISFSSGKVCGINEFFEFKYLSGGLVALVSKANELFLSAENAAQQCLVSNRSKIIGTWEVFELRDNSDGSISLRSLANAQFLSANNIQEKLVANKSIIGPWEKFKIINLFTL